MKRSFEDMASSSSTSMNVDTVSGAIIASKGRGRRQSVKARGRKLSKREKAEVKKLISVRQELKYWQVNASAASMPAPGSWVILPISAVPQGDTDLERDGDRLMWCGTMEFNYIMYSSLTTGSDVNFNGRVLIAQWHPNSNPTVSNFLLNGPSANPDVYATYSHDYRQQYTILYDNHEVCIGNGQAAAAPSERPTTGIIRVKIPTTKWAKQAQYAAGSTNGTNQLYIIYGSDTAVAGANRPFIAYSIKIFFRDS